MTDNLPAKPLPDDMIDRVAREVAAQIADHIEAMYPAATEAVAWGSAKRSIQGVSRNVMKEIARAAESGDWEKCLHELRQRRQAKGEW